MTLPEAHRRQYHEEGYTVVRGLIPREETARVRSRLLAILEGDHDWPADHFQVLDPARFRNRDGGFVPIGVQLPARREPVFQETADHPRLRSAMSGLLGGPVTRYTDQALIKSPDVDGVSFYHQDWRAL